MGLPHPDEVFPHNFDQEEEQSEIPPLEEPKTNKK